MNPEKWFLWKTLNNEFNALNSPFIFYRKKVKICSFNTYLDLTKIFLDIEKDRELELSKQWSRSTLHVQVGMACVNLTLKTFWDGIIYLFRRVIGLFYLHFQNRQNEFNLELGCVSCLEWIFIFFISCKIPKIIRRLEGRGCKLQRQVLLKFTPSKNLQKFAILKNYKNHL